MADGLKVLVVHGPNLDRLGTREPDVYGTLTLEAINEAIEEAAKTLDVSVSFYQSNSEGELVSRVNTAGKDFDFIIINPAAYTHSSHALGDAVKSSNIPAIEVHISNVGARESFRRHSLIAGGCVGTVAGFGKNSYIAALELAVRHIKEQNG